MKELLESNGWEMYDSCFCGGTLRQEFRHKSHRGYVIKIRPKHQTFSIFNRNWNIKNGKNYELKKALEENEII